MRGKSGTVFIKLMYNPKNNTFTLDGSGDPNLVAVELTFQVCNEQVFFKGSNIDLQQMRKVFGNEYQQEEDFLNSVDSVVREIITSCPEDTICPAPAQVVPPNPIPNQNDIPTLPQPVGR